MASYKRRQSSDYNQSVPETEFVPENHAYQEKHFQPTLNQPVSEAHTETEYGPTVTPDRIESRADRNQRSTVTESSDQPGEEDLSNEQFNQNLQGNSDPGTQYSTPDVSSGVSSGSGGFATVETGTVAAGTTTAASTVVATSTAATVSSVAITTAGVAIIAATLILPLVVGVPSAIVFEDIHATDTSIYYSIYFEDYEEDMELTVSLHNNFTNRTHTVESSSISVLEENLKPGMEYKITVYGSMSAILEEKTVKTSKSSSGPELDMKNFDYSPQEGRILIDSELKGDTTGLTAFKAVVYANVDDVWTALSSTDLDTLDGEQSIPLNITKDKKYNATFMIEGTNQDGETVGLYTNDLTVFGTPYYSTPTFMISDDTLTVLCGYYDPYSARSDYQLVTKVMNSQSADPVITYHSLNCGVTTVENISGGYDVFEMMAYVQYSENGTTVYPEESSYDYNSLDALVTTGTARAIVGSQMTEGHLKVTVGDCSETLTATVRVTSPTSSTPEYQSTTLMNNTTSEYTFDLLSENNANVELQFYVETNGNNPIRGAYGTVVFAYASFTGNLSATPLDPSESGPGTEIYLDVNDPYSLWSDYRATVTISGTSVTTLCSDVPIVDNKVYFTTTDFENGAATLTVTCTQDGSTVTVVDSETIQVYSGPTITLNGDLNPAQYGEYDQSIVLYAEFYEFGSSTEPKELYAFLFQDDKSKSSQSFTFLTTDKTYNTTVTFEDITSDFTPAEPITVRIYEKRGDDLILIAISDDTTQYYV